MATAFSSSLLGLAGSLVVGLLELFVTHGQNRFYRELEEWMSGFTRIGLGGTDGQGLGEAALAGFIDRVQVQLAGLQEFYNQRDELRDQEAAAADQRALALAQGVEQLAGLMGTDRDSLAATLRTEREATAQALAGLESTLAGLAETQARMAAAAGAPREAPEMIAALERLAEGQARLVALAENPGETAAMRAAVERMAEGQARLLVLAETSAAPGEADADAIAAREMALNKALNRMIDGQTRLIDLTEARATATDDPESRMRLRSIDELLGRLVEESASGRDGLISELREDMAALTRAIRNLERGDGT
jgi:hypothetical protein